MQTVSNSGIINLRFEECMIESNAVTVLKEFLQKK